MILKEIMTALIEAVRGKSASTIGAVSFFLISLFWVLFGFWQMLFILLMTALGYCLGLVFFKDQEHFRRWLDRFFPPGFFR